MESGFLARLLDADTHEDRLTEVFATLLEVPPLGRAFFENVLCARGPREAPTVHRQYENRDARGVPDLALIAPDLFMLIENKLGAAFTVNQPCEYVKEVQARSAPGRGWLVVQVPEKRKATLGLEIEARLRILGDPSGCEVHLITWEQTAAAFAAVQLDQPAAFLRDNFIQLVRRASAEVSAPLTEEHVTTLANPNALAAVAAVEDILRDVFTLAPDRGLWVSKPYGDFDHYGFDLRPTSDDSARELGVCSSFRTGAKLGAGPLFVQLTGLGYDALAQRALAASGATLHAPTEPSWVPRPIVSLHLQPSLDPPAQAQQVLAQIAAIIDLPSHAGGPSPMSDPHMAR